MKIELNLWGKEEWPHCYYNPALLCGERETGRYLGYNQEKEDINISWFTADMCNCPSCPLRCAIAAKIWEEKK